MTPPTPTAVASRRRRLGTAGLLFITALAVREGWCFVLPLDAGNDEITHLYTARLYASLGRLAVVGQDPGTGAYFHPVHGFNTLPYYFDPPGAHALAALVLSAARTSEAPYLWARQLGVVAGAAAVVLAYLALAALWPLPSPVPAAVGALMAFAPEVVFVGSYFSDEWLALPAAGLVYTSAAALLRRGLTAGNCVLAAASLAVLSLARLTYWPCGLALLLAAGIAWKAAPARRRLGAMLSLALPLLVAGAWIGRNQRLYGDWRGGQAGGAAAGHPAGLLPGFAAVAKPGAVGARHPYLYRFGLGYLARSTFMSFWGVFGYMGLLMPPAYYALWAAFCAAAAVGWLLACRRLGRSNLEDHPALPNLAVLGAPLLVTVLAYVYWNLAHPSAAYQPQGRYLFCALVPLLTFLVLGVRELLSRFGGGRALVPLCAGLALAANGWSLWIISTVPWPQVTWIAGP